MPATMGAQAWAAMTGNSCDKWVPQASPAILIEFDNPAAGTTNLELKLTFNAP
jgi:hypothetical protein